MKVLSMIAGGILLILFVYLYNNFFTESMLKGKYVAQGDIPFVSDFPYVPDTLTIVSEDGFVSHRFGAGTYFLSYSIAGTEMHLLFKRSIDLNTTTTLSRLNLGAPMITFNKLQQLYYLKFD